MSAQDETTPLLAIPPPSFSADDNVNEDLLAKCVCPVVDDEQYPSRIDIGWILAGVWSAVLLGAFDGTVVATLLTPIGNEFGASNRASYIGTSYLLSLCCFTPLYGRLADIFGRKGAMLLALSLFGAGTISCAAAPSMSALILTRTIAGMGGGGIMTVASIIVSDLVPLSQRGIYQGMANILYGLGASLGGPFGGWVNDNFGWRVAFYIQAPPLLFSFIVVSLKVNIKPSESDFRHRTTATEKLRRIDFLGSFTLVGAVGSLLLGLCIKETEDMAWSSPVVYGLFIAGIISGALFIWTEARWASYPVMPLRLTLQRTPFCVAMSNFFMSMTAFSMIYNIPLYFSTVRLSSASEAGSHLLPHSMAIGIGSVFAGWIIRRTNKIYTLTIVSALMMLLSNVLVSIWNEHSTSFHLWTDAIYQGFGMASLITSTLIALIAAVRTEDMPIAIGISYLFRTTGQVLGVSLSGAALQAVLRHQLRMRITGPNSENLIQSIRRSTNIIPTLDPVLRKVAVDSYADALRAVFVCQAAVVVVGFLFCLPIQEPLQKPAPATVETPREESSSSSDVRGHAIRR